MSRRGAQSLAAGALEEGRAALARADWAAARSAFERALAEVDAPELLEGLGVACRWLSDAAATFAAHDRAYRLYRERGDQLAAARIALLLTAEHYYLGDEHAVAMGWLERAARLLEGLEQAPEHGWLAISRGHLALQVAKDPVAARDRGVEAMAIGRSVGVPDIEMLGLGLEGVALVFQGEVAAGMRRLDEATAAAVAGELSDIDAITGVCCYLIDACKQVRDYERASQWCGHVKEVCARSSDEYTFAVCRLHYADVLVWSGDWEAAEHELKASLDEFRAINLAKVGDALARLGELRRQQGRAAEAAALFRQADRHPVALIGRAELALADRDSAAARLLAERYLNRLAPENRTERVTGLEVAIRASLLDGDVEEARGLVAELEGIASAVATDPLEASAARARGLLAAAERDPHVAAARFETAADLFERAGAPFDAAGARVALARALAELGQIETAAEEADAALAIFQRLGAETDARDASTLVRRLQPGSRSAGSAPLTRRELDIVRRIAEGRSNEEIAADLVLSVRTVERHVSNVYRKVGLSGRSARAAIAAYAMRHGLA